MFYMEAVFKKKQHAEPSCMPRVADDCVACIQEAGGMSDWQTGCAVAPACSSSGPVRSLCCTCGCFPLLNITLPATVNSPRLSSDTCPCMASQRHADRHDALQATQTKQHGHTPLLCHSHLSTSGWTAANLASELLTSGMQAGRATSGAAV